MDAQAKMRETVLERRQRGCLDAVGAEAPGAHRCQVVLQLRLRKAPQSAPDACGWTLHEQYTGCMLQNEHRDAALRTRTLGACIRQLLDPAFFRRHAYGPDGAGRALRRAPQAYRRAEIHEALRIGFDIAGRQKRLGERPKPLLRSGGAWVAFDRAVNMARR